MPNEADICRTFVIPKLQAVGWDTDPHRPVEHRDRFHSAVDRVSAIQAKAAVGLDAMLLAVLDRAFRGEL
jgi:hypothetical protein